MAESTARRANQIPNRFGLVAALALLVGAGYLLVWIVESVLALQKEVAVAIVAGFAAVVGTVLTVVLTNRANKLREIAEAHRPEKMKVYDKYMRFLEKDRRQREKLSRIYGSLAVIAVVVFFLILLFAYLS